VELVVVTNTSFLLLDRKMGVLFIVLKKRTARLDVRNTGTAFVVEINEVAVPCVLKTI